MTPTHTLLSGTRASLHSRENMRRILRGFTLAEVLVSVAILAILAAVVVPAVFGRVTDANNRRKAATLSMLAQAVLTFHDHVGMWPSSLVQLTTAPAPNANNACSLPMAAKDTARWLGPYVALAIPSTGLVIDKDTIRVALTRSPAGVATAGVLQISMQYPVSDTRNAIQDILDTDTDSTTGAIRWTGTDPLKTLTYSISITGC
jgi:prepilin-type N-terminal cleavage/methylation domain-containing protein